MKLLEFFRLNAVKNLYTVHKDSIGKVRVYSLTYPVMEPTAQISSFFDKSSLDSIEEENHTKPGNPSSDSE